MDSNQTNQPLVVGSKIELEIKKMGINGEGIGYYQKTTVFVEQALPDEIVEVQITMAMDKYYHAKIEKIIKANPDRLDILYPDYLKCGAFGMQHLAYPKQLEYKRDILVNALNRYLDSKVIYAKIKPMVSAPEPLGYRNKVSLPARKIGGLNKFGLFEIGSNTFIPVNDTPVQNPKINLVIQDLERLMDQYKFDSFIAKEQSGYLKSVVIRRTHYFGEIQVSFLLMRPFDKLDMVVAKLVEMHPEIVSVFAFYTDNYKEQTFFSKNYQKVFGKDTINEKINGQTFSLYPEAFFQLNTPVANLFYKKMVDSLNLVGDEVVIDAYAGSAMISHYVYDKVKKVYAIEIDQRSVQSAILSLKRNKIKNVVVMQSDFTKALKNLADAKIDVMFFDPPRTGLGYQTIKQILKFKPKRIVYGSCNPSTLAKDLSDLLKEYDLIEITPFDMFPYTPLVESVSVLELKD